MKHKWEMLRKEPQEGGVIDVFWRCKNCGAELATPDSKVYTAGPPYGPPYNSPILDDYEIDQDCDEELSKVVMES